MSMLELGESGSHGDLSHYYSKDDLDFFAAELNKIKPLADKIRGAVPKLLLAASLGVLSLGAVLGNREIFVAGIC